ncbi:MAG TPA: hypothetical protein VK213_12690 [Bacteroidales bacterium]|nr:hypothetical protein [Bacteroidales bacterium]
MKKENAMLGKVIKSYGLTGAVILVVIISVVFRFSGTNRFRPDAFRHALPSVDGKNIISSDKVVAMVGKKLVVRLDSIGSIDGIKDVLTISPSGILSEENISAIRKNKGPVLLLSGDPSLSARTWMLLAQKGVKEVYIISDKDDEEIKNKFRRDTLIKPEIIE